MRLLNILDSLDMLVNSIFGGYPGETVSGRSWRLRVFKPYCWLVPALDFLWSHWEKNHCETAFRNRNNYVPKAEDV